MIHFIQILIVISIITSLWAQQQQQQYFTVDKDANYNFGYIINDRESGAQFNQQEQRAVNRTEGSYSVRLPDTRLMKVTYVVDGNSGYVADINYEGEAQYLETTDQLNPTSSQSSPQLVFQGGQAFPQTSGLHQSSQFSGPSNNFNQGHSGANFPQGFSQSLPQGGEQQQGNFLNGIPHQQQSGFPGSFQRQQRGVDPGLKDNSENHDKFSTFKSEGREEHLDYSENLPTVSRYEFPAVVVKGQRGYSFEEKLDFPKKQTNHTFSLSPLNQEKQHNDATQGPRRIFKPSQSVRLSH